jgi:hypothetical protein
MGSLLLFPVFTAIVAVRGPLRAPAADRCRRRLAVAGGLASAPALAARVAQKHFVKTELLRTDFSTGAST